VTSRTYPMICYISPFYLYLWAGFLMEVLMYKIFIVYFYQIDCYLCTIFFFTSLGIEADIFFPVKWLYEMTWFCWWQKWLTFCRACNSLTILCFTGFHINLTPLSSLFVFFKTLTQGDIGGKSYYWWRWW